MNPVIYYHPEAYTTSGPKLMGRNAAGESFLRGFLTHSKATAFWAQVQRPEHGQHFVGQVKAQGRTESVHSVAPQQLAALAQAGLVYYPGPGIGQHAFHRSVAAGSHAAWSLCGITHTTSSAGAMDAIAELITAPVQPWDAVICTSTAVKDNVNRLLQAQVNMLKERLGISKLVLPMLPVIPLGIHTQDFVFTQEQKNAARQKLKANDNTLVVLFMGRLSFHAKAHPLAMYQALQKAAQSVQGTGKKIKLVECGWHANEFIEKAYRDAALQACPDVEVITLDGRKAEDRQTAWAGADVFCSLSDNIQETFGIVPIEAMAAGLPVVVSDWDGYKDTVRHEVDGFRINTTMPEAGLATDLALRHALEIDTYDMYCGHTCSLVSVDIEQAAKAFVDLFESAALRQTMGEAGRTRAQQVYDWKVIIGQYEALWAEQQRVRLAALQSTESAPLNMAHAWPARMDPFHAFANYPTQALKPSTVLCLADSSLEAATARLQSYQAMAMVSFAKFVLPSAEEIAAVLKQASTGPQAAMALVQHIDNARKPFVFRTLVWFLKLGILKLQG
jgi:glycosyltransferase involved in cell wall biosynthesis